MPYKHRHTSLVSVKCTTLYSRLDSVIVIVLAIRPKVRGFKPGRGDGFLRAIKIRGTPFFGEEVKPTPPYRKILRHVKGSWRNEKRYT
jgi:hypothetical protein